MYNDCRHLCWLIVSTALTCAAAAHSAEPAPAAAGGMLYLNDGDYFSGRLRDCPAANILRWQASGATGPFEFNTDAIRSAYFAPPPKRPAPDGEYCIELSNGDVLYGSLTAITKDDFEIDSRIRWISGGTISQIIVLSGLMLPIPAFFLRKTDPHLMGIGALTFYIVGVLMLVHIFARSRVY